MNPTHPRRLLTALLFLSWLSVAPAAHAQEGADSVTTEEAAPVEDAGAPEEAQGEALGDDSPSGTLPLSDAPTAEEVSTFGGALRAAIELKQWPVVVGLALTGFVYVLRRFDVEDRVGTSALPWVVLGLSVGGNLGAALAAGVQWVDALWAAGYSAAVAMAGWDLSGLLRSGSNDESSED